MSNQDDCRHEQSMNDLSLKIGLDVMQSHPTDILNVRVVNMQQLQALCT